jgi:predicted metal-dependent hydrolase
VGEQGLVELVVPCGVSEARARDFLASRAQWVAVQVARRQAMAPAEAHFPPQLLELSAVAQSWRLFQAGGSSRARLSILSPGILRLDGVGSPTQWRRMLVEWLCEKAHSVFLPQLTQLAHAYSFDFSRLSVRCQRTRWGSCSSRGTVSINVALLFQKPAVVRYLLCHELAHTRFMNHSAKFWACVAECEPAFRSLDAQLVQGWSRVPLWLTRSAGGP